MQETLVWFLSREQPLEKDRLTTPVFLGFPGGSAGEESACNVGDLGSIPALGRSPGEGKGYPLQYSGLENSMDCIVHGVAKNRTRLSDFNFSLGLCLNYTTLPLWPQSSYGWYENEWVGLFSNKTLLRDTEIWISFNFHMSQCSSFDVFFKPLKNVQKPFLATNFARTDRFGPSTLACRPMVDDWLWRVWIAGGATL